MLRVAHIASPTLAPGEVLRALARPMAVARAEREAAKLLGLQEVVLFASARGALSASAAELTRDGGLVMPAYTCAAVPNAAVSASVPWRWGDVDARGNLLLDDVRTGETVLVQDAYGFVAPTPTDGDVIRDSSHRIDLVATQPGVIRVGSFEHSKWLSAGQGGLAAVDDPALAVRLRARRDALGKHRPGRVHAAVTLLMLCLGRVQFAGRGAATLLLFKLSTAIAPARAAGQSVTETRGWGVDPPLLGPPGGAAAALMVSQLRRAPVVARHRSAVVALYDRAAGVDRAPQPLLRYPMLADDREAVRDRLADAGWDLGRPWFVSPVHPAEDNLADFGYVAGTSPGAERLAASIVTLPTHDLITPDLAATLIRGALAGGARPVLEAPVARA